MCLVVIKIPIFFSPDSLKGGYVFLKFGLTRPQAELSKMRALQSYQEAKYKRQGKIKSKKYRKIARKEKAKEKVRKTFEIE